MGHPGGGDFQGAAFKDQTDDSVDHEQDEGDEHGPFITESPRDRRFFSSFYREEAPFFCFFEKSCVKRAEIAELHLYKD
jgi:hypothetical protein